MITSDRRARMLLCCAVEGGDPAVAELVQNLGAEGAKPRSLRALGEPVARRAARITAEVFERLAKAAAARFVVPVMRSGRADLMIFDMSNPSSGAAGSRLVYGCAVQGIWLT
jgi:hypothetical protein